MSIQDKLDYLSETKDAIKNALIEKGAEVGDDDTFRSYADKIEELEIGSSEEIILDDEVTETSENAVKSSGIYTAIQDAITTTNEDIATMLENKIQYSTVDIGSDAELDTGALYLVYEGGTEE